MLGKVFTATTFGLEAKLVECEVDISPGMPKTNVVGLANKAVQESKERVRTAIKQSGFDFPIGRITFNLAPADLIKNGTGFDLPMAVALLQASRVFILPEKETKQSLFIGELSLDRTLKPITGVLSICIWAKKMVLKKFIYPKKIAKKLAW